MSQPAETKTDVTLEDVEIAIKVLERYIQNVNRARSMISRLQSITGRGVGYGGGVFGGNLSLEQIIAMATEVERRKREGTLSGELSQPAEKEFTSEELAQIKALTEKHKVKPPIAATPAT